MSAEDDRDATDLRTGRVGKPYQTLPGRIGNDPTNEAPIRHSYQPPEGAKSAIMYSEDPPPDYEEKTEMYSEPAADYDRAHDSVYRARHLHRSHDDLQRSHDDLRRSRDNLRRSRDDLQRSRDSLNNEGSGRRYRGSYDYEFYQPK